MSSTPKSAEATQKLLANLWQRNLPVLRERLRLLESAAASAEASGLREERRIEARDVAHKLAGSLGMFGYPEGTEVARKLELELDEVQPSAGKLTSLTQKLHSELSAAL